MPLSRQHCAVVRIIIIIVVVVLIDICSRAQIRSWTVSVVAGYRRLTLLIVI